MKINLRKLIFINKKFQLSVLAWASALGIVVEVIFYSANLYFFKHMHNEAVQAGLGPDNIFFQYLDAQKAFMDKVFLLSTLFSMITIIWGGLYLSHRVAGPLYRFTSHLKNFNRTNIVPLKFRKGDYFIELQEAFNEFIERKD